MSTNVTACPLLGSLPSVALVSGISAVVQTPVYLWVLVIFVCQAKEFPGPFFKILISLGVTDVVELIILALSNLGYGAPNGIYGRFIFWFCYANAMYCMLAVSMVRLIHVIRPTSAPQMFTPKVTYTVVVVMLVMCVPYSAPLLIPGFMFVVPGCDLALPNTRIKEVASFVLGTIIYELTFCTVTVLVYVGIFAAIVKARLAVTKSGKSGTAGSISKQEKNMLIQTFVIAVPYLGMEIAKHMSNFKIFTSNLEVLGLVMNIYFGANPFVYLIFNAKLRAISREKLVRMGLLRQSKVSVGKTTTLLVSDNTKSTTNS